MTDLEAGCRACHAGAVQRWRAETPELAVSYNLARRVNHEPRLCVECGEPFVPGRSDARV